MKVRLNIDDSVQKKTTPEETFTQRFRRLFPAKRLKSHNYKKEVHKYPDKKYGKT